MLQNSLGLSTVSRLLVLCAVILVPYYLPTELSSPFLVLLGLSIMAFCEIQRSYLKLVWPLFAVLIIGSLGVFDHESRHIFRDVAYALTPITLIFIGYWIAGDEGMWPLIFKVMATFAFVFATVHLSAFVLNPALLSAEADVLRATVGTTGDLVVLALLLGLFQFRFGIINLFPKLFPRFIALPVLLASFVLSFSRTQFVVALILILSLWGLLTKLNIRMIISVVLLIVAFFAITISTPENEVGTFRSKLINSFSEMTVSDYRNMQDINTNWRGFETYRALATFSSGDVLQQIFGQGFGSLVDLGYYQELAGRDYRFIPITHNGYVYILLKTGIVGLLLYVVFYMKVIGSAMHYSDSLSSESNILALLLLGCVLSLVSTMFVVGGMAEMHNSEIVLLLGYLSRRLWQLQSENTRIADGRNFC